MPSITLNFANVPTSEPVPAGDYLVEVDNCELRENKEGKIDEDTGEVAKYLSWELVITEGEYAGRKLFDNTSLKLKALWKLRKTLINLGAYNEEMELQVDEDTNQVLEPEVIGKIGTARVIRGKNNRTGEAQAQVTMILDPDGVDLEKALRGTQSDDDEPKASRNGSAASSAPDRSQRKMTLR